MQTVVLIIHLLLALALMGVVLLQRSEGGGLGIGGSMGPQAGRPPLTGLAKLTWMFAGAFIVTSLTLTVIAASNSAETSVLERIGLPAPATRPDVSLPDVQLPPGAAAPLLPPAGSAPALPPATTASTLPPVVETPAAPAPASEAPAAQTPASEAPAPAQTGAAETAPTTVPAGN